VFVTTIYIKIYTLSTIYIIYTTYILSVIVQYKDKQKQNKSAINTR